MIIHAGSEPAMTSQPEDHPARRKIRAREKVSPSSDVTSSYSGNCTYVRYRTGQCTHHVRTHTTDIYRLRSGRPSRSGGATWAVGLQIESGHERTLAKWPTRRLEPLCGVRLHAFLGVAEFIEVALYIHIGTEQRVPPLPAGCRIDAD